MEGYLRSALSNPKSQAKFALEITGKCVCNCFHCYAEGLKKFPDMPLEEAELILKTARGIGFNKVYIVGGEPMLHKNIVEICQKAKELGFFTILVTNGYKLDSRETIEFVSPLIDQFEISVRSNDPLVHNRIISGRSITDEFTTRNDIPGGHAKAIEALANLSKIREEKALSYSIVVNHDLHTPLTSEYSTISEIIKQIYDMGGKLDGFYTQVMAIAGRAKQNLEKFKIFQISKKTLLAALEDLTEAGEEYKIQDLRLVDDPVALGIVSSIDEIPEQYHKLLITEYIPAICKGGFKPNVIEETVYEGVI